MTTVLRSSTLACALAFLSTAALAQTPAPPSQAAASAASSDAETRPATTTFFGDTGLWFVPTAEVLGSGKWSASGYRRGTNWIQGYTNVADFAGTFAYRHQGPRRNLRLVPRRHAHRSRHPADVRQRPDLRRRRSTAIRGSHQSWTGDNVGDLYVGAKINLWSEYRQNPAAIAAARHREAADRQERRRHRHRQADFSIDSIVSKEPRRSWRSPASAATNGAAARTASTLRAARSAGARASGFRRATSCASSAS